MKKLFIISLIVAGAAASIRGNPPLNGVWEGEIQSPRRPIVITVNFDAARVSLSGGTAINMSQPLNSSDEKLVAFEFVTGGQTLKFAGKQNDSRITGEVDLGERKIPFWLERLPILPKPADRNEAWRQDIDVVTSRFLRYDRSFSRAAREAARARLEKLRGSVDRLSDQAIMVELARAIALSGNAHTRLYLIRNRTEVRRVPLRVWWFRNELRVVRAANEYRDLAGCRVIRIGELAVTSAFQKVSDIKAGNTSWQRYMSAYFLTSPDILFGAGILATPETLPMLVDCGGGTRPVNPTSLPLRKSTKPVEAWWDLAPSYQNPDIELRSALTIDKAPLYLRHPDRNYWVEYLAEPSIIYLQYNRSEEMSTEPMADFIRGVTRLLDEHTVKGLVVDVRFNTGGDAGVGTPLVETLAARLKGIPVVVLTGRATFSAGISHTAQWRQFANASIVGEPIGDNLDLWSEGGNLVLPNSGLTVHYANGFHRYSQKDYPEFKPYFAELNVATLAPDEVVEPSWSQYLAGSDPVLEAAFARILRKK